MSTESADNERFDQIRRTLLRAVRLHCPAWLVSEAEDMVQSALARSLENHRARGIEESPSLPYLMTAARHALIDEIRRKFRRVQVPLSDEIAETRPVDVDSSREAGLSLQIALRYCLGRLALPRRAAVTLHLLGHTSSEASDYLGQSRKSVEHLTYRGLDDLRDCLSEKGEKP